MNEGSSLLSLDEVSALLAVSKKTLRRWTSDGLLPCVRVGPRQDRRFRRADVEVWLDRARNGNGRPTTNDERPTTNDQRGVIRHPSSVIGDTSELALTNDASRITHPSSFVVRRSSFVGSDYAEGHPPHERQAIRLLDELGRAILTGRTERQLLQTVVDIAVEVIRGHRAAIYLLDETAEWLDPIVAVDVNHPEDVEKLYFANRVPVNSRLLVPETLASATPVWCEDTENDPRVDPEPFRVFGTTAFIATAIRDLQGCSRGVIVFSYVGGPHVPTAEELEFASLLGSFASLAISNLRWMDELQRAEAQARSLGAQNALLFEQAQRANAELEARVEERTRQLREAQEQLLHAERLAALGQLSASVAHGIRNPLNVIRTAAYFLRMRAGESDTKVRRNLDQIDRYAEACNRIITDLVDFSQATTPRHELVHLNAVVRDVMAGTNVPPHIGIRYALDEHASYCAADSQHVRQMISNVVTNAIQAIDTQPGTVILETERETAGVRFTCADTGCGMDLETLSRAFQPLVTTKAVGSGLGLAIVRKLADANGARIEIASHPGEGTRFSIWFAAAAEPVE